MKNVLGYDRMQDMKSSGGDEFKYVRNAENAAKAVCQFADDWPAELACTF
ncbi:MAG: hypothetical protein IJB11_00050 [Oscillospiraceae bacterium]|nr:hypothetical protein [Oscillospiraceae bacterium]